MSRKISSVLTRAGFERVMATPIEERLEGWEEAVDNYVHKFQPTEVATPPQLITETCRVKIHPAQDFTKDKAYTTQFLDYEIDTGEATYPTLITSDRRTFILTEDRENELVQNNLRLKYTPMNISNRWSIEAIIHFLKTSENQVELSYVFDLIHEQIDYYLDWSDKVLYDFFAVWFIGTYFHQLFTSYPYVELFSSKASGKTKLLVIGALLSFNGYHVTGITPATLFRMVQDCRTSLFIDEAEYDKHDIKDLRGLLSGYTKGVLVPRAIEKKIGGVKRHDVEFYEVYSPKMLAGISGVENVLADRCITTILERPNLQTKEGKTKANRYPDNTEEKWCKIRDLCYSAMLERFTEVRQAYDKLKEVLSVVSVYSDAISVTDQENKSGAIPLDNDTNYTNVTISPVEVCFNKIKDNVDSRDRQLWLPIYAIAYAIDWSLFERIVDLSVDMVKQKKETNIMEDNDTILYEWLLKNIHEKNMYTIRTIKTGLIAEVGEEYWVNERNLGKALRRIKVVLKSGRTNQGSRVYLDPTDMREKAVRFGIDLTRVDSENKEAEKDKQGDLLSFRKDEAEVEGEEMISG